MSVDFLNSDCKEPPRTDKLFGLCDNQDSTKAYTDIDDSSKWIATVKNEDKIEVVFTPIDNCVSIMKSGTKDEESTCDGMVTFLEHLYLVELKKRRTDGWLPKAKEQLENTIRLLNENHDVTGLKRKAYACNKKHPSFVVINSEEKKAFFKKTNGFIIHVEAEIVIKPKKKVVIKEV